MSTVIYAGEIWLDVVHEDGQHERVWPERAIVTIFRDAGIVRMISGTESVPEEQDGQA
jgi:hypothetical protein